MMMSRCYRSRPPDTHPLHVIEGAASRILRSMAFFIRHARSVLLTGLLLSLSTAAWAQDPQQPPPPPPTPPTASSQTPASPPEAGAPTSTPAPTPAAGNSDKNRI